MPGNGLLGLKLELGKPLMLGCGARGGEKAGPTNQSAQGAGKAAALPSGTAKHAVAAEDRRAYKGPEDAGDDQLGLLDSQPVSDQDAMLGEAGAGKNDGALGLLIDAVMGEEDGMDPELTLSLQVM
jgi:hypothetical protein